MGHGTWIRNMSALGFALGLVAAEPVQTPWMRLQQEGLGDDRAMARLAFLCDRIGPRIAGSPAFLKAVDWASQVFREDGQEVRLEPVTTHLWVRGRERAMMTLPVGQELSMLGLGESVGASSLEASVVRIRSFEELGPQVKGKIVLYDPALPEDGTGGQRYGVYIRYRLFGASRAAAFGAVAVLIKSAPVHSLGTAHTGTLIYDPAQPKIPAATVSAEHGAWMARLLEAGQEVRVNLDMEAHQAGPVKTANVIAELKGSEHPEEIVLLGAHLDSWDVGQGAQDDGAGVIQVMEALRLLRASGLKPKRTVRAVLFVNEEHGTEGAKAYAEAHRTERHVAAIETDAGAGHPRSWSLGGTPEQVQWFTQAASPLGLPSEAHGGGVDVEPLQDHGFLVGELGVDLPEYFDVHHTQADTLDKVDPRTLREGIGALAALAWQLSNAPEAPKADAKKP